MSVMNVDAQPGNLTSRNHLQSEKIRFERISVDQGLSDNNVICIMQDRKGFMWFGTWNGLNRYDGYTITNYFSDPRDTSSLSFNVIYQLHEDDDGKMWVVIVGSILNKFDPHSEKFSRFRPDSLGEMPIQLSNLRAINEDKEGTMWVGNSSGQVGRFDKKTGRFLNWNNTGIAFNAKTIKAARNPSIAKIFKDRNGNLWLATNNGLFEMKLGPKKYGNYLEVQLVQYKHEPDNENSLSSSQVSNIFEDSEGIMWIGTELGLNRFDKQKKHFTRFTHDSADATSLSHNRVSGIAEDKFGNLWVATRNGLNKLEKRRKGFIHFFNDPNDPTSLGSNLINSLMIDRSNFLWVATLGSGVNKVNLNKNFVSLHRHNPVDQNSLSNNKVTSICEDKTGTLWIGTAGGGLNSVDKQTGKYTRYFNRPTDSNSLGSNQVSSILEDSDGVLWVGGGMNGNVAIVSKFNRATKSFINYRLHHQYKGPPSGNPLLTIYEDRKKQLWIGTTDGYFEFDKRTGTYMHYPFDPDNPEGVSDFWVNCIYEDKNGYIWLGPNSNDMNRLDPRTRKVKRFKHNPSDPGSISSGIVIAIFEDSKQNVWFATRSGGLCKLNPDSETFQTFTKDDGLASNTIYSILEDDSGYLWLTTNKGLSRFSYPSKSVLNLDINDGLQSNQFETEVGRAGGSFKGKDGMLYFGGVNGFNALNPYQLRLNDEVPPIVITRFKVFDQTIEGKNEATNIVLNHDQNFFSFEFTALNFDNALKNEYAYKLEGVDKDWIYSGNRRFANYTNIDPGSYVFRVKGSNNSGLWNEAGTSVRIRILAPWWRTWWFYILCTGTAISIIILVFQYRLRQRQKIYSIRNRLHRDLHDDVGSTLSSVKAYSEILERNPENPVISTLIKENASEMIERLEIISWATDPRHDNLQSLTDNMLNHARPLLHVHNIELNYTCTVKTDLAMPGHIRQNIYLIFKEAVNNMIKYANASQFFVHISIANQKFGVTLADNGKGSDGTIKGGGRGMKNMEKRAVEMHGSISIESDSGTGTRMELLISYPFKNTRFMV
jgi:ligand-binding sensor domain-containing protein/two-component sensor histidine kinase